MRNVLPGRLWSALRAGKRGWTLGYRRAFEMIGLNVARRRDYYSPLPVVSDLRKNAGRWVRPSPLTGIRYDVEASKTLLSGLLGSHLDEFLALPNYEDLSTRGYGPGYTETDALILYAMIRDQGPRC